MHVASTEHMIRWGEAEVVLREEQWTKRKIKESFSIKSHDRDNHRVQVLNSDLTFSRMFGSKGNEHGQFYEPVDVDVDNEGFVHVTDSGNDQGQFNKPVDIDVDNEGFVYVTDSSNNCVQKFTPDGLFGKLLF